MPSARPTSNAETVAASRRTKKPIHGFVSPESRAGWDAFTKTTNTALTRVLEAIGLQLAAQADAGTLSVNVTADPIDLVAVVATAQERR